MTTDTKLSPAQQRMMDRLNASKDGHLMPPFGGRPALPAIAAFWRTANALAKKGLIFTSAYDIRLAR